MKKYLILTAASICMGLTSGCSDSDDSREAVHNVRAEPDLQGTFSSACSSPGAAGQKVELKFEGNSFVRSQVFYSGDDCATETGRLVQKGEFVAGEQNNDDPRKGGTLDLTIQEVKFNVAAESLAKALNNIRYCGQSEYAAGKETVLTQSLTCPVQKVPAQLYTVYRVENDRLYLGDKTFSEIPDVAEKRAESVIYETVYLRGDKGNVAEAQDDMDKTLTEAKDDTQKTYNEAESDVKKTADEAKADAKKTYEEAESDVKKTAEQAETDVKQTADKAEQEAKELEARN